MNGGAIPPGLKWLNGLEVYDGVSQGYMVVYGQVGAIEYPIVRVYNSNVHALGSERDEAGLLNHWAFNPYTGEMYLSYKEFVDTATLVEYLGNGLTAGSTETVESITKANIVQKIVPEETP